MGFKERVIIEKYTSTKNAGKYTRTGNETRAMTEKPIRPKLKPRINNLFL
jgi:hypothetical protein